MMPSKIDGQCRKCSNTWVKGDQLHLMKVDFGSPERNALSVEQQEILKGNTWISCTDEACYEAQGGKPYKKKEGSTPPPRQKNSYASATDSEVAEQQAILDEHDRLERLAVYCLMKNGEVTSGGNVAFRTHTLATIKSYLPSVEIGKGVYSFREDKKLRTGVSSFPSLPTINEGLIGNKVMDNVKLLVRAFPTFFSEKKSGNQKIELYYRYVFGIDVEVLREHSAESITRSFRAVLNPNVKNYEREAEYRRIYSNVEGTKDMSLLHD